MNEQLKEIKLYGLKRTDPHFIRGIFSDCFRNQNVLFPCVYEKISLLEKNNLITLKRYYKAESDNEQSTIFFVKEKNYIVNIGTAISDELSFNSQAHIFNIFGRGENLKVGTNYGTRSTTPFFLSFKKLLDFNLSRYLAFDISDTRQSVSSKKELTRRILESRCYIGEDKFKLGFKIAAEQISSSFSKLDNHSRIICERFFGLASFFEIDKKMGSNTLLSIKSELSRFFMKLELRVNQSLNISKNMTLNASFRSGILYGEWRYTQGFFLGGAGSIRGYPESTIQAANTSGGSILLQTNFNILYKIYNDIYFQMFLDSGSVSDASKASCPSSSFGFGFVTPLSEITHIEFNYLCCIDGLNKLRNSAFQFGFVLNE